jgi:hypothetical protein
MARQPVADMSAWPSLSLEGNLIAPAMVAAIDRREAGEQADADYGIRKGLTIREEISLAFRVGQSHVGAFLKLDDPGIARTRRFLLEFLSETFGFEDIGEAESPVAFLAGGRVPVVAVPPSDALDRRSADLSAERSRSATFALQDYLNEQEGALWGIACNGRKLRLMRDNASLTRPAFIEADLEQIFANDDAASFAALWLLIHRSRFGQAGAPAADCALERWRDAGAKEGVAARDRMAGQVEQALKLLGTGFLKANPELAGRIASGAIPLTDWFNELLRLVYRLIFLMVAEDRGLLHAATADADARRLYAEGYGLAMLRGQCLRAAARDRHHDRFEAMKIVFRALAHGEPRLGLPALGGLFARGLSPTLEGARLPNREFLEALFHLAWLRTKGGLAPINWRAMETEELGSVYESLLELQPQLGEAGRALVFAQDAAEQKGNQRKTTGSYYTPDSLVQALLDTALDPVLDRAEAEADDPEAALLALTIVDPACGSGHFLLAAARRVAGRLARLRADGTPSLEDFRHALRDVARCCIHGIDRNPMAVELTKVALWIETVDPGLPLGFFDAQVRCGDALLGLFDLKVLEDGIPDAAYKPLTGDDKPVARHYLQKNRREKAEREAIAKGFGFARQQNLMQAFTALRAMPEDSLTAIETKAARLARLTGQGAEAWALHRAADAWVAAFLAPKIVDPADIGPDGMPRRGLESVPTSGTAWEILRGSQPPGQMVRGVERALDGARVFHWPLEFPDIMARGGFDVVVGNPPWERIKLQEQEFFAARSPEIAGAANKAARDRLIRKLAAAPEGSPDRQLHAAFEAAKRQAEATSLFARLPGEEGGRYPLTGRGDVNTYALFAELFARATRDHAGVIVPTGIATDATTAPFFAWLVETRRLARLVDFENRKKLFAAVDSRMKFSLLTLGREESTARFAFFLTDTSEIAEPERNFTLTPEEIARLNPNTLTAPTFRTQSDALLTARIFATSPVLVNESNRSEGNPWGLLIQSRIWHLTEDSEWFRTGSELSAQGFVRSGPDWIDERTKERCVPLYEAKMVHHFDHRWATYSDSGDNVSDVQLANKQDCNFEPLPRYWVPEKEVRTRYTTKGWNRNWLVGWRDITNASNERTVICSITPYCAVANSLPLMLSDYNGDLEVFAGLLANLSTLTLDYAARHKVGGTHLNAFLLFQLPVLPPKFYSLPRLKHITPRVLELTYTSHSMAPFARDLGYEGPPFRWDEERRALLRAELDAFYARAYGLDRDELRYILDPADVMGPDYPSETFRVLKEKEIRAFGEYRTRRLVLEAWDRMESDGTFRELGM